ncbi:cytochrome P450 [Tumebacillus permanentifrigoris]|uniref:Cytochrome P450 n=1 Tax=Tumebacillus permanentifrigoris TaxID=378543 RepID=A0A316DCH5_9BACL|nr:cytochrome P450 [Tumebacillus permanentifrigoris]PWK13933.1 cytochrome P450 [Tumebacillus permanentifrigoris]
MTANTKLVPPGPVERSVLGSLTKFRRNPSHLMVQYWQEHGELYRMRLGPYWVYVPTHPDHVKHVMVDNLRNYSRGKFFKNFERFIGKGLVAIEGDEWAKHRRIIQPTFHRGSVGNFGEIHTAGATELVQRWDEHAAAGETFDAAYELFAMVLSTFGRTFYNMDLSVYAEQFIPGSHEGMLQLIQNVLIPEWVPTAKNREFKSIRNLLDDIVARIVDDHRQGLCGDHDLVSTMLKSYDEGQMTLDQVHDEVLTLLVVGTDTTTAALSWALYCLTMYGEERKRLEEEVDRVLNGRVPTVADLASLPYTMMFLKEVLRLYPPVWILTRDPISDDEIAGYHIPAGSTVMTCPYLVHRNPEFWENPEAFVPERFLPELEEKRHRYAYIPFGAGQHQCVGMHSSLQQMHITMAMIIQKFKVELAPSGSVIPSAGLTMHPADGVRVKLTPRGTTH